MASEARINWTNRMDDVLVNVLKEEHLTGGRHLDGIWKSDALAHVAQEAHPSFKGYRSKVVPYFDDMDILYVQEKVTGLRSYEGSKSLLILTIQSKDMEVTSIDAVTQNEKRNRKRWEREDNEEKMLLMGMLPGMTEDDILYGMDLFGPDPQLAETFLGLSDERKKGWLWRRLKRTM
ncbi:hypothetical protein FRX31_032866 [Thalictrum thalictroides]|uniref:Uncharacterized protein n=1 Tax=Thalictrum thalictroides TaxID=46969 RepID=A0A7J6UY68_THATH|nr:hypothetical protein FRX31_032866 [Thalictrum thalictroides]